MSHAESGKKYKVTTPRAFIDDNLLIRSLYSFRLEMADSRKKMREKLREFSSISTIIFSILNRKHPCQKKAKNVHIACTAE